MKIYLVGGAVRDRVLGVEPKDLDYVVVGATVETFKEAYPDAELVGKKFPVFLARNSDGEKCEFAFARKEVSTGSGHKDFDVIFTPDITLDEDLYRRDFTMNAMAILPSGEIYDPYGGQIDIMNNIIRHVSSAFTDDPLRVYRLARFCAKYPKLKIHPSTTFICRTMTESLRDLPTERVWLEFKKSLDNDPKHFLDVLNYLTESMGVHFPEFYNVWYRVKYSIDPLLKFCELVQDMEWENGRTLCFRLKVPTTYRKSFNVISKYRNFAKHAKSLSDEKLVELYEGIEKFPSGIDAFFEIFGFEDMNFVKVTKTCLKIDFPESYRASGGKKRELAFKLRVRKLKMLRETL